MGWLPEGWVVGRTGDGTYQKTRQQAAAKRWLAKGFTVFITKDGMPDYISRTGPACYLLRWGYRHGTRQWQVNFESAWITLVEFTFPDKRVSI